MDGKFFWTVLPKVVKWVVAAVPWPTQIQKLVLQALAWGRGDMAFLHTWFHCDGFGTGF
jgi:hypothetical protein